MKFQLDTGFFASSSVIFAGSFVINVLNYVFTLIMSRLLGVAHFGEVAALLSLFLIISVPATALSMLMAREAAYYKEQDKEKGSGVRDLFVRMSTYSMLGAFGLWAIFLVFVPLVSGYLQIRALPIYIFSFLLPLTVLGALQSGTLQGLQEFLSLSKQGILGTLIKLIGSIFFVTLGFSVAGVMGALVLASLCGLAYGFFVTRSLLAHSSSDVQRVAQESVLPKIFGSMLLTTFLLALLSNVDVLLAKHYLSPELAGQYSALSSVGKILIYGVGAFITVLLPMAAAAHARGEGEERKMLWLSLGSVAVASLSAFVVFSVFPHLTVSLLFGGRYLDIAEHLGMFTIAMACIALGTVFINYFVATRNTSFVYLLGIGIATEVALITLSHDSLGSITQMLVYSSALLLFLMAANYFVVYRPK